MNLQSSTKKKNQNLKKESQKEQRKQKSDEQPDITDMPD